MKIPKINIKTKFPKPDFYDLLIVFGGAFLGRGLHMIYPPAMFIIIGIIAIWLGLPGKVAK